MRAKLQRVSPTISSKVIITYSFYSKRGAEKSLSLKLKGNSVMIKPEKKKGFDEWEISDAYRTLTRAEEIKMNPELMKAVKKYIEDQEAIKKKVANQVGAADLLYGKGEKK